jgi:hypothetical protein
VVNVQRKNPFSWLAMDVSCLITYYFSYKGMIKREGCAWQLGFANRMRFHSRGS